MNDIPIWCHAKIAPCICRILAKAKGRDQRDRVMTDAELMKRTGWGKKHLRAVYQQGTWKNITNGDTDLFLWACGLHPSKQRRYLWLLKRALRNGMEGILKMRHLRADVAWQRNQVRTLLRMIGRVLEDEQRRGTNA